MAQESLQIHRIIQILIENPRRTSELAKLMETFGILTLEVLELKKYVESLPKYH